MNVTTFYRDKGKRALDVAVSGVALAVASPVLLAVTAGLAVANHGKPFFFQTRPGKDGELFRIVKFKTMNDRRGADGELLPDAQRLTPVGAVVRRTSLDELPQLVNVLKGDMSLVGPRPLLPQYLPLYSERQARRHEVRPGITGWAQVNGRNAMSWESKFEHDVYYVENLSPALDARILLKTVQKVLKSDGISQDGHVTMEPFRGSDA